MSDPLAQEAREASLLTETMEEICRFLDSFPLAEHFVASVDDANALRLSMLGKLADSLCDSASLLLRRLDTESCVFSFALEPSIAALSCRLRPSNFRAVAQQGVAKLSLLLLQYLQRQAFQTDQQAALFAANCGEDLRQTLAAVATALGEAGLSSLQPLWDSCALLALPAPEAEDVLATLKRVEHCSPSELLVEPPEVGNGVLRRKETEVLAAAGVQELSTTEAISVLSKRTGLAGAVPQDSSFSVLQELLPASAAQGALQLSAGALQQLGELGAQAPLPVPVAAMAQATLQTGALGVDQLRGLAGGAGRRLAGRLRSSLAAAAAATPAAR